MTTEEPKKSKKEMLSVTDLPNGKTLVKINYSSLSVIQSCMRKAYYILERELRSDSPSPALTFGSAIHKALEVWYLSDLKERIIPVKLGEKAQLEVFGHEQEDLPVFRAIRAFREVAEPIWNLPETDKRSLQNGAKIIAEYCRRYKDDGLTVVSDKAGPIVEREMRYQLVNNNSYTIEYFGTVDAILENKQTGQVCVVDHKTTSQLGAQFFNRLKPNHQYTGYILGARACLGLDTNLFMINGVGVYKTKQEFARQFTDRTEEDFREFTNSVVIAVEHYLEARESGVWAQSAPDPCTNWGGCAFLKVCEVPDQIKENVIRANWKE